MTKKFKKIKKRLCENISYFKCFGIRYAYLDFKELCFSRSTRKNKVHLEKYNYVKKYLLHNYNEIIVKYKDCKENKNTIEVDCPIFIMWWQGLNKSPFIVKKCIERIKKFNKTHKVIIIDKDNYKKYLKLSPKIIEKLESNNINLANVSDYIRIQLLYKYGGIWIDGALLVTREFDFDIFNYSFFTINHGLFSDYHVCKGKWTTGFMAVSKNNLFIKYLKDIFDSYLEKEKMFIAYFLIDCFIAIGYENIDFIREEIDKVPKNNEKIFELTKVMSEPYSKYKYLLNDDTYIYRATYKEKYINYNGDEKTMYYKIIKEDKNK